MRILYIVSRLKAGGPSNQLRYLIEHLDDSRFEFSVLTLSPETGDSALPEYEADGIPVQALNLSRANGLLKGPREVVRYVEDWKPDVVHTQGLRPDLLSALFLKNCSRVATIRNYPYDDYPMKYGWAIGYPMAWAHMFALPRIDHPVACSYFIKQAFKQHSVSLKVVQNGVDTTAYTPASAGEKRALREKLGLPVQKTIFISVGSLIARKNPSTVVEGFLKSNAHQHGHLVFLGEGPQREVCEARAQGAASVHFAGFVDGVADYLKASDYFISASQSEGLPNTVLEAMASGLPVCLSDIVPHREALGDSGAGILTPIESQSLARAIDELVAQDQHALADRAAQHVQEHFTARRMSEKYQALYEKIVGRPSLSGVSLSSA